MRPITTTWHLKEKLLALGCGYFESTIGKFARVVVGSWFVDLFERIAIILPDPLGQGIISTFPVFPFKILGIKMSNNRLIRRVIKKE